jgi:Txe/YoeB family toxin of toxin-antitoxin system
MYRVEFTKKAIKDAEKIKVAGLKSKVMVLMDVIKENPYKNPPPYEKLQGFTSVYSRRINVQHRLVYEVCDGNVIKVVRMWTHYE